MNTRAFKKHQHAFTLVELMISMTIGLMILLAISSVYLSSQQTSRTNNALAYMQDSGRITLELLASHLSHAGFFGRTIFISSLSGKASDATPLTYTTSASECAPLWGINITTPLQVFDNNNPYAATCIDNVTTGLTRWTWIPNTDVLELRNADTTDMLVNPTVPYPNDGQVYVIGDVNGGTLFFGNSQPPSANYAPATRGSHAINAYAYFVAQRSYDSGATWQPALMRVETFPVAAAPAKFSIRRVEVTPGIEDMQVEIGRDTTGNDQVDTWSNAVVGTNYNTVKALRIWLLIRAEDIDTSFNPNGTAITYNLGQQNVVRTDQYRRMVLTRTITLANN